MWSTALPPMRRFSRASIAGPVEVLGPEADHFLVVLRRDVHDDPARAQVPDGEPERGTADAIDDDIKLTAEMLGNRRGAEAAHQLAGRGGIAYQRGARSAVSPAVGRAAA
jgi:hypothetical protein